MDLHDRIRRELMEGLENYMACHAESIMACSANESTMDGHVFHNNNSSIPIWRKDFEKLVKVWKRLSKDTLRSTVELILDWRQTVINTDSELSDICNWFASRLLVELLTQKGLNPLTEEHVNRIVRLCFEEWTEKAKYDEMRASEHSSFFGFKSMGSKLKATVESQLKDRRAELWSQVLGILSLSSMSAVHKAFESKVVGMCSTTSSSISKRRMVRAFSYVQLQSSRSSASEMLASTRFLRAMYDFLIHPNNKSIRKSVLGTISLILKRSTIAMNDTAFASTYSAVDVQWENLLRDLSDVAQKYCAKKELSAIAWDVRMAVLGILPDKIFRSVHKEEFFQMFKHCSAVRETKGCIAMLQMSVFAFKNVLQRHLHSAKSLPSHSEVQGIIEKFRKVLFPLPKFKSAQKFVVHFLPCYVDFICSVAYFDMNFCIQQLLRNLLLSNGSSSSALDEKKVIALVSFLLLLKHTQHFSTTKLIGSPVSALHVSEPRKWPSSKANYGDEDEHVGTLFSRSGSVLIPCCGSSLDFGAHSIVSFSCSEHDTFIKRIISYFQCTSSRTNSDSKSLDKCASSELNFNFDAGTLLSGKAMVSDIIGHILIECNSSYGNDLILDVTSSSLSTSTSTSTSVATSTSISTSTSTSSSANVCSTHDYKTTIGLYCFRACVSCLRYLYDSIDLRNDQTMMILSRSLIHSDELIRSETLRVMKSIVHVHINQLATIVRGITDFIVQFVADKVDHETDKLRSVNTTQHHHHHLPAATSLSLLLACIEGLFETIQYDGGVCGGTEWQNAAESAVSQTMFRLDLPSLSAIQKGFVFAESMCIGLFCGVNTSIRPLVFRLLRLIRSKRNTLVGVSKDRDGDLDGDRDGNRDGDREDNGLALQDISLMDILESLDEELKGRYYKALALAVPIPQEEVGGHQQFCATSKMCHFERLALNGKLHNSFLWSDCLAQLFPHVQNIFPALTDTIWAAMNARAYKEEPLVASEEDSIDVTLEESKRRLSKWRNYAVFATSTANVVQSESESESESNLKSCKERFSTLTGAAVVTKNAVQLLVKRLLRFLHSPSALQRCTVMFALRHAHSSIHLVLLDSLKPYEADILSTTPYENIVKPSVSTTPGHNTSHRSSFTIRKSMSSLQAGTSSTPTTGLFASSPTSSSPLSSTSKRLTSKQIKLQKRKFLTHIFNQFCFLRIFRGIFENIEVENWLCEEFRSRVVSFVDRFHLHFVVFQEDKVRHELDEQVVHLRLLMKQDFCAIVQCIVDQCNVSLSDGDYGLNKTKRQLYFRSLTEWCQDLSMFSTNQICSLHSEKLELGDFYGVKHVDISFDTVCPVHHQRNENSLQVSVLLRFRLYEKVYPTLSSLLIGPMFSAADMEHKNSEVFRWIDSIFSLSTVPLKPSRGGADLSASHLSTNIIATATATATAKSPYSNLQSHTRNALRNLIHSNVEFIAVLLDKCLFFTNIHSKSHIISKQYFTVLEQLAHELQDDFMKEDYVIKLMFLTVMHAMDECHHIQQCSRSIALLVHNYLTSHPHECSANVAEGIITPFGLQYFSRHVSTPSFLREKTFHAQLVLSNTFATIVSDAIRYEMISYILQCSKQLNSGLLQNVLRVFLPWFHCLNLCTFTSTEASEYLQPLYTLTHQNQHQFCSELQDIWRIMVTTCEYWNLETVFEYLSHQTNDLKHLKTTKQIIWWCSNNRGTVKDSRITMDRIFRFFVNKIQTIQRDQEQEQGENSVEMCPLRTMCVSLVLLSDVTGSSFTLFHAILEENFIRLVHTSTIVLYICDYETSLKQHQQQCIQQQQQQQQQPPPRIHSIFHMLPIAMVKEHCSTILLNLIHSSNRFPKQFTSSLPTNFSFNTLHGLISAMKNVFSHEETVRWSILCTSSFRYSSHVSTEHRLLAKFSMTIYRQLDSVFTNTVCSQVMNLLEIASSFTVTTPRTLRSQTVTRNDDQLDSSTVNTVEHQLLEETLITFTTVIQSMDDRQVVMFPQALWIGLGLLNTHSMSTSINSLALKLLKSLISKPIYHHEFTADLFLATIPSHWSPAECSVEGAVCRSLFDAQTSNLCHALLFDMILSPTNIILEYDSVYKEGTSPSNTQFKKREIAITAYFLPWICHKLHEKSSTKGNLWQRIHHSDKDSEGENQPHLNLPNVFLELSYMWKRKHQNRLSELLLAAAFDAEDTLRTFLNNLVPLLLEALVDNELENNCANVSDGFNTLVAVWLSVLCGQCQEFVLPTLTLMQHVLQTIKLSLSHEKEKAKVSSKASVPYVVHLGEDEINEVYECLTLLLRSETDSKTWEELLNTLSCFVSFTASVQNPSVVEKIAEIHNKQPDCPQIDGEDHLAPSSNDKKPPTKTTKSQENQETDPPQKGNPAANVDENNNLQAAAAAY